MWNILEMINQAKITKADGSWCPQVHWGNATWIPGVWQQHWLCRSIQWGREILQIWVNWRSTSDHTDHKKKKIPCIHSVKSSYYVRIATFSDDVTQCGSTWVIWPCTYTFSNCFHRCLAPTMIFLIQNHRQPNDCCNPARLHNDDHMFFCSTCWVCTICLQAINSGFLNVTICKKIF